MRTEGVNTEVLFLKNFSKEKALVSTPWFNPLRLVAGLLLDLSNACWGLTTQFCAPIHKFVVVRSLLYYYRPLDRFRGCSIGCDA